MILSMTWASICHANPSGGQVTHGQASFEQQGNTLSITNTPGTIIQWQDFSIATDEITRFIQQNRDSAVLNRINGQNPSTILGSLQSNGQVYLINPNGIVFGQSANINVAGLVASTLNISDRDFLDGKLMFSDHNQALLQNFGIIETPDSGDIYLIGTDVENHGIIRTSHGNILLAAGESVNIIDSTAPEIEVQISAPDNKTINVGEVITQNGQIGIYSGLIEHQGIIKANRAIVEGGKIILRAEQGIHLKSGSQISADGNNGGDVTVQSLQGETLVEGSVSAQGIKGQGGTVHLLGEYVGLTDNARVSASGQTGGGTILIGGDNKGNNPDIQNAKGTYIALESETHADAGEQGDGGTVIVWSDEATRAYGTITAKGGSVSGQGGFVETSGGYLDIAGIDLDIAGSSSGGTWLLDPYDITITNTTTINVTGSPSYTPTASGSNINTTDINALLDAGTAVIIDTTGGGSESGNITVSSAISKTTGTATSLTLKAHNNIVTNASIGSSSGALAITLTADQDSNNSGSVTLNSTLSSLNGNITISAAGDITLNSGTTAINAGTGTASLTSTNGIISGDPAGGPKDIIASAVTLNAANGIYANGGSAPFYVDTGSISFNNSTTGLVRIYNNHAAASSVSGTHSGTGNVIIESFDTSNPFTISGVSASNGYISFRTGTINITGSVNAGTNTVYLKNYSSGAIVGVGTSNVFDLTTAEIGNITAGNIIIGQDTFGNYAGTASVATSSAVDFGGKNVWIKAQNGITFSANNITNSGGELYADNVSSSNITTGGGVITADKVQFRSIGNVNIGSGGISSTATGNVYLFGADINITGTVGAGTNSVYLSPYLSNTAISIGGAQTFDLTQSDLANINAGMIYVGENLSSSIYASTVDITNSAGVNIGNRNITVKGTGNITTGSNSFVANGGSGSISLITSSGSSITTGAGTILSDSISMNSAGTLTIGSGGLSTTGAITLASSGNILQSGNIVTSGTSNISLTSSGGTIAMGSANDTQTNGGTVSYTANGNISLGRLYTGVSTGSTNVTSSTGAISDAGVGSQNIYSGTATLSAATGIGSISTFFNNLGTTNLTASTTSGGINITSQSAVNLGSINSGSSSTSITTTGGGSYLSSAGSSISGAGITLNSSDNMTIGAGGITSSGNLSLTAALNLSQNGNLTTSSGGSIQAISNSATFNNITSAGNIGIESDQVTITNPINAGSNTVYIMPRNNNTISIDGASAFDLTQGEINNISAGTLLIGSNGTTTRATTATISSTASTTVSGTPLEVIALNGITFGANNFTATGTDITFKTINAGTNITTGGGLITGALLDLLAPGTVTVGSGGLYGTDIAIEASDIDINGSINGALLQLNPYTAGTDISIGGSRSFNLSQADINNIGTTTTYIGNDTSVVRTNNIDIASSEAIDFGARTIYIDGSQGITTGGFSLQATGGVLNLTSRDTGFDIITAGGNIAANSITLNSANDITLGTGGITAGTSINVSALNNITQSGNLTASGGGSINVTATSQSITMASGTITSSGNSNIIYTTGGNLTLAMLDSGTANTSVSATGNIIDANGTGVNNINANILTVSSGGSSSLDYIVTSGVNSSGVIGLADLRNLSAGGTTTTTTTTATTTGTTTTTEATNTITETISSSTTETSTSPAETLATDTESSNNEDETKEENSDSEGTQLASQEQNDDKPKKLTKKKLRSCN